MPTKRAILEQFSRDELLKVLDSYELSVSDRRIRSDLIQAISSSRRSSIAEILSWLGRERLKEICRGLGIGDGGREKLAIVDRICGTDPSEVAPRMPHETTLTAKDGDRSASASIGQSTAPPDSENRPQGSTDPTVFIVHGHDLVVRTEVENLLRRMGVNPVVLDEQANRGQTVIEKFEAHGGCDFAVVLLTPDDCGGPANSEPSTYRPRARQNVLLELGFFMGKLGRHKVSALYKGNVEIPSDYSGVAWIDYDGGGRWMYRLGRELREAGLPADANKI